MSTRFTGPIVDGLAYMPDPPTVDYLQRMSRVGVAATNVTVAAVDDDLAGAVRRIGRWRAFLAGPGAASARLVTSADDLASFGDAGRTGAIFGLQDAAPLENRPELAGTFAAMGVRIVQLTYQRQNLVGSGCGEGRDSGLTGFGRELIAALNEAAVAIDLSHCGPRTTLEAIEASRRPCLITHSAVHALSGHVRAKSDEAIRLLAQRGGAVGVAAYAVFLHLDPQADVTLARFVDHLERIMELGGPGAAGLGLDFTPTWTRTEYEAASAAYPEIYRGRPWGRVTPTGLERIEDVPAIADELARRGHPPDTVAGVMGGNWLRVLTGCWR